MATVKSSISQVPNPSDLGQIDFDEDDEIPITSLSLLTGFPVQLIKKELVLEKDFISMRELRRSMMSFLKTKIEKNLRES
ncbi:MAG: hypothetical protein OXB84_09245 [Halobacteriovoraceae bacterium]|nr:hypothetical protein [Halobacteriovoraceae bacterium]